jgi:hypothetical protein
MSRVTTSFKSATLGQPKNYVQLLRRYLCAKKVQTLNLSSKATNKMLVKLTPSFCRFARHFSLHGLFFIGFFRWLFCYGLFLDKFFFRFKIIFCIKFAEFLLNKFIAKYLNVISQILKCPIRALKKGSRASCCLQHFL